jgi:hypothetical protein
MRSSDGPLGEMFRSLLSRPMCERRLAFLDMALDVRFADEPLGRYLCRALAEWEEKPVRLEGAVRCVIDYTDAVPHWREVLAGEPRSVANSLVGEMQMLRSLDGYAILLERLGAVVRLAEDEILCLVHDAEGRRYSRDPCNLDKVARIITASCLLPKGYLMVHAGGVACNGRCHLWTGPSGIGKTTRVLELVSRGWDYCGDDVLILGKVKNSGWHVFPGVRTAKVMTDTCKRFAQLTSLGEEEPLYGKHVFAVDRFFPTTVPRSAVVDRIYCIGPEPELRPRRLGESEALARLMAGFLYYLWPEDAGRVLAAIWDIVSQVPVYAVSRDTCSDDGVGT